MLKQTVTEFKNCQAQSYRIRAFAIVIWKSLQKAGTQASSLPWRSIELTSSTQGPTTSDRTCPILDTTETAKIVLMLPVLKTVSSLDSTAP